MIAFTWSVLQMLRKGRLHLFISLADFGELHTYSLQLTIGDCVLISSGTRSLEAAGGGWYLLESSFHQGHRLSAPSSRTNQTL